MICPYCLGDNVKYLGIIDGAGDWGNSICDYYKCEDCGDTYTTHCIDIEEPEPPDEWTYVIWMGD